MTRFRASIALAAAASAALAPTPAWARCVQCRDSVAAAGPGASEAFSVAILLLLAAPYVVGGIATIVALPGARSWCAQAIRRAFARAARARR